MVGEQTINKQLYCRSIVISAMEENKACKGDIKCLGMERGGAIINTEGRWGFTEKILSDHRQCREYGPGSGNNSLSDLNSTSAEDVSGSVYKVPQSTYFSLVNLCFSSWI